MKILILGEFGMLGSALVEEFSRDCSVLAVGHEETDISSLDACLDTVGRFRPEVIINAAALERSGRRLSATLFEGLDCRMNLPEGFNLADLIPDAFIVYDKGVFDSGRRPCT
jgi:hypothetical protein